MERLSQYTDEQLQKYHHRAADGDLDAFLRKFKPSIIETSDAPWILISNEALPAANPSEAVAVSRGADILSGIAKRMKEIEHDSNIPTRARKGQESKKVVREREQAEAVAALKALSLETGYKHGKWLLYPSHESVDGTWARIARSVAAGPLRDAGVYEAKVATTANPENSQVVCVYYDDVYDKDKTEKILLALLGHGLDPSAVKSDLYTAIGLDSKHEAKLRSSVWRPVDFMTKDEVKALKDAWSKEKEAAFYTPAAGGASDGKEAKRKLMERARELTPAAASPAKPTASPGERELAGDAELNAAATSPAKSLPAKSPAKRPAAAAPAAAEAQAQAQTPKRVKSKARAFRDNDIFAASDSDESE